VDYYDSGQPKKETLTRKDGTLLSETAYTYNTRGDLATRTDTRPATSGSGGQADTGTADSGSTADGEDAATATAAPVTTHTVHAYDAYGRLTSTTVHNGGDAKAPVLRSTAY
uniref:hypothetical protein n=1 Tax=Streptomyces sp. NRRL F-2664 TaxID=1463842 RepID=UPI0005BA4246